MLVCVPGDRSCRATHIAVSTTKPIYGYWADHYSYGKLQLGHCDIDSFCSMHSIDLGGTVASLAPAIDISLSTYFAIPIFRSHDLQRGQHDSRRDIRPGTRSRRMQHRHWCWVWLCECLYRNCGAYVRCDCETPPQMANSFVFYLFSLLTCNCLRFWF